MDNWVSINRNLANSDVWLSEPFTRGQAWVDLIILAQWKPGQIRVRGNRIDLERGDIGWSKLRLSKRWLWSRGKLDRFLMELKRDNRIVVKQDNRISTVLSITNYDLYQPKRQQTEQQTDNRQDNRQDTNNKDKKEKNVKKGKYSSVKCLSNGELIKEVSKLYSVSELNVKNIAEEMRLYCGSTGKKYSNYKMALQKWTRTAIGENKISIQTKEDDHVARLNKVSRRS